MKLTAEQRREMKRTQASSGFWFFCKCGELHPWKGGVPTCAKLEEEFGELIDKAAKTERRT
jgi:hypothetical protein